MRHDAFLDQPKQNNAFALFCAGSSCLAVWRPSGAGGFFYVLFSEVVRLGALAALVASFFTPRYVTASVNVLMAYCVIMMLLNFYGAFSYVFILSGIDTDLLDLPDLPYYTTPRCNLLWFKKDRLVPVEHGFVAAAFYMYFLLFAYFFAAKHVPLPGRDKKQQRHARMPLP